MEGWSVHQNSFPCRLTSSNLPMYTSPDHKLKQSLRLGDNLLLKLHTPKSARVVAQRGNTSSWEEMWVRGEERLEERLEEQEGGDLVLRGLRREDEGTYRVLDAQGLAVSTLKVTVNGKKAGTHQLTGGSLDFKHSGTFPVTREHRIGLNTGVDTFL